MSFCFHRIAWIIKHLCVLFVAMLTSSATLARSTHSMVYMRFVSWSQPRHWSDKPFSDVTVYRFSFHTYCSRTRSNPLQRWGELSFNISDLFELWSVNLVVGTEFMWLDNVGRCFMFHFYVSCTSMHFILVPTFLLCSSFLACPSTDPSDSKSVQWKHFPFSYSHRTVPPSISNQAT